MSKEEISLINIIYTINEEDKINEDIRIFGSEFVKKNKNICKMIIDDNEYEIAEEYNIKSYTNNELKIKLKIIGNITDMSYMFDECYSLSSLSDISKLNTSNVTDMSYMFIGCHSLLSLPDISK